MKYLLILFAACAFPDISKIDLQACTDDCNARAKVCFANSNEAAKTCSTPEKSSYERTQCVQAQLESGEACITNLASCNSECVGDVQKQLGGK